MDRQRRRVVRTANDAQRKAARGIAGWGGHGHSPWRILRAAQHVSALQGDRLVPVPAALIDPSLDRQIAPQAAMKTPQAQLLAFGHAPLNHLHGAVAEGDAAGTTEAESGCDQDTLEKRIRRVIADGPVREWGGDFVERTARRNASARPPPIANANDRCELPGRRDLGEDVSRRKPGPGR